MNEYTKTCNKCNISKSLTLFHKRNKSNDGYEYTCKECKKIQDKKYKTNNIEKIKTYIENNKDKITEYHQKYHKTNKDKISEYHKEHYKKYEYQKHYSIKNRTKINKYNKNKYYSDPQSKLKINISNRIRAALKTNKTNKNNKTTQLLGCDIEFYKTYLENQFKLDMTWENHGILWEIDHIKPCAAFNLTDPKQQHECFHYLNTQPLYRLDNRSKKDKYN